MKTLLIALTLLLTCANTLALAQVAVELASESACSVSHHDSPNSEHEALTHHCCHTHSHVYLMAFSCAPSIAEGLDHWPLMVAFAPAAVPTTPPVPPPRA